MRAAWARCTGRAIAVQIAAGLEAAHERGRRVDKRTDIWAFGCVLWEMLTGRRLFHGDTVTDVIAAVVTHEPEWEALPALPARVPQLLRRCLDRDVRKRLRDIGEARIALESPLVPATLDERRPAWKARLAVPALLVAGLAVVLAAAGWLRSTGIPVRGTAPSGISVEAMLDLDGPARVLTFQGFALSPAGDRLAFVATDAEGSQGLWLRALDGGPATPLPGTVGAAFPFWSPDGRVLGFSAAGQIQTVDVLSGATRSLCATSARNPIGTWSHAGPHWSIQSALSCGGLYVRSPRFAAPLHAPRTSLP